MVEDNKDFFSIDKKSSIIFKDRIISYNELQKRLRKIACTLLYQDTNKPIAIFMDRNEDMILSILAVMKIKSTYVPIDVNYPQERINYILHDCNIEVVLTHSKYKNIFDTKTVICIDEIKECNFQSKMPTNYTDVAYILYTSGSTGVPKGIEITRNNLINFIKGVSKVIDFKKNETILCLTIYTFDIFFLESIAALNRGLTVILADDEERKNPRLIARLIEQNLVDIVQMTPSSMQLLYNSNNNLTFLKNAKKILIGGENFPLKLLKILQRNTDAKIYNMYGPTETTIWSTISDLTYSEKVNVGKPIRNTKIYIVDEDLFIVKKGVIGEICIAGEGLAKGYLNNFRLTKDKFITLPEISSVRVYRTGDLGKYSDEGNLECFGRKDNQVKIRGHRIEVEEIESILNEHNLIQQSLICIGNINDSQIMIAFYISDTPIKDITLSEYLVNRLPQYMIPSRFIMIKKFLYTPNGKVDRVRTIDYYSKKLFKREGYKKENNRITIHDKVLQIICNNIDKDKFGKIELDADLLNLGIDSIAFIKIIVSLEEEFDFQFEDEKLQFEAFKNVRSIAKYVESKNYRK